MLQIAKQVQHALREKKAVVALESTIITHGMPYPKNMETALLVEETIKQHNAVPATIAIINGQLKAGLSKAEIETLAKAGKNVSKASRRDIPYLVATQQHGATTVAATMIIAAMAGISIFATGGIGGVHRGGARSMDVSADLQELAKTNVAVVCAGAKAILDLALTKEYLETHGVPLLGFRTKELPAFYSRKSGLTVDYEISSVKELAVLLKAKWQMNLQGGVVIANPIPETYEMEYAIMNEAIDRALIEADKQNLLGKEITPFLLSRVEQITQGKSLEANIQLVLNNAKLAAELAVEMKVES